MTKITEKLTTPISLARIGRGLLEQDPTTATYYLKLGLLCSGQLAR